MQFYITIVQLLALSTGGLTHPTGRQATTELVNIRVNSNNPELTGRLLTSTGEALTLQAAASAPVQLYTASSDLDKQLIMHVAQAGNPVDHVLALDGAPGLQALVYRPIEAFGGDVDAYSFLTGAGGDIVDSLASGSFVAVPTPASDGWAISWYDGQSPIVQDYFRVILSLQPAV